ncbi:uncharacterized protein [Oryza sativa Japonica Group]|uniref:Os07g0413300 protein n=1 Tax=Oryza sativa subsp. japonica TaxID=39947 RepID=B7F4K4_ORYSJ|nr:uncharacterized protein LOC4343012 isoform X2 [Oryza sativa Japonica Group]KAB8105135.1 hypothetical protein EE612_038679 [Oryza sativa]BAG99551.1 unnamed protein product [Oryza sativa Japonica Group]BAT01134.1 Os07g0413300 [Oryza sativa Japonica Group]
MLQHRPLKVVTKKPRAAKKKKSTPPPLPPRSPSPRRLASSEHTPSAVDSHHLGTPEHPPLVVPVLANMFSFDVKQFLDEEEEETTSGALVPLDDDLKTKLMDIAQRLGSSLDSLVTGCGSIRARFEEIHHQIPEDEADIISLAVYLEQHRFKLERAQQRIADMRERAKLEATIEANRLFINEKKVKLDEMIVGLGSTQVNIDRLKTREAELVAELEACRFP